MNEREATQLLERLGGMLEVSGAPVERVVDAGKLASRRRRRWQVGGAAAAVAVVVVGGGVIAQQSLTSDTAPPTSHTTPPSDDANGPGLTTPPGTRLVGAHGVVVAVPSAFTTEDLPCGTPMTDTVTFRPDFEPKTLCTLGHPRATLVTVADTESRLWSERLNAPAERVTVDDLPALQSPQSCDIGSPPPIPGCIATLTFPSAGVSFEVYSSRPKEIARILDSAQAVPDDYVTVPSVYAMQGGDAAAAIEAAGLTVDPPCSAPRCYADVIGTDPPAGTPVADGSTVSLLFDHPWHGSVPSEDDLLGTWRPSRIGDREHIATVLRSSGGSPLLLTFDHNYTWLGWRGYDGCNWTSGRVHIVGGSFSTSHDSSTLIACTGPKEYPSIPGIVTAAASVTLDNGHLRFYDRDARLLATFVRVRSGLN